MDVIIGITIGVTLGVALGVTLGVILSVILGVSLKVHPFGQLEHGNIIGPHPGVIVGVDQDTQHL